MSPVLIKRRKDAPTVGSDLCCSHVNDLEDCQGLFATMNFRSFLLRWLPCLDSVFLPLSQTQGGEAHIITSDRGMASSYSTSLQEDNSAIVTFLSPPMPLPFDDPRFSQPRCQHDKLGERYDDTSSYCHEVPVPLRSTADTDPETKRTHENRNESLVKDSSVEATSEVTEIHYSSEEEDDCPICLEEYTSENPRIILQCNHHYHLSCIYEWMERSQACPICCEVMLFNEATSNFS